MNNQLINSLRRPFTADRIEWRLQSCGTKKDGSVWAKCLAYIDNRAAMERLDEVFGACWSQQETFATIGQAAVCTVQIHIENVEGYPNRTVTGSCAVEANGDIDAFKSAASGAMKRAVVNLGIGRYLYNLPEAWGVVSDDGEYSGKTKDGTWFKWSPPTLPDWALPDGSPAPAPAAYRAPAPNVQEAQPHQADTRPAPAADGSDPWTVQIHFGKNKGKALRDLPENTFKWYAEKWKPEPFKGKISSKDLELRGALDKILGVQSQPDPGIPPVDEMDEVPF